jgi:hypothetical protein
MPRVQDGLRSIDHLLLRLQVPVFEGRRRAVRTILPGQVPLHSDPGQVQCSDAQILPRLR